MKVRRAAAWLALPAVVAAIMLAGGPGGGGTPTPTPTATPTATATGTPTATPTSTAAPSTANLFVDTTTSGNTCTRSSTAIAYSSNNACNSFDAAYDAASCGDLILVKGGTYSGQTTTGSRTCTGWTETVCTGCVKIVEYPGETAHLSAELITNADWSEYVNFSGADDWEITASNVDHVMLRNFDANSGVYFTGNCGIQYISMIGGDLGNQLNAHGQLAPGSGCGATWMQDVLFQGVDFHDVDCTDCGAFHVECLQTVGGTRITFRANKFRNCSISDLQLTEYNGSGPPTDYLIENNWFGTPNDGGSTGFHINSNASAVIRLVFQYNSMTAPPGIANGVPMTDAVIRGNYGPAPSCSLPGSGWSFVNNVWQGGTCGASDTTDSTLDFLNTSGSALDLHITDGSGAEGNGDTTCPNNDYDGEVRPQPAATTCDAGADERT